MRKNHGFTLLELLAVIVILAVISLIATPLIMNVIEDAKKESARESAYGIIKAGEIKQTQEVGKNQSTIYSETSGLEYSGTKASKFLLVLDDIGRSSFQGFIDGVCLVKEYPDKEIRIDESKKTEDECVKSPSFKDDTWEMIVFNVKNENTSFYKVGDTKEIELKGLGTFQVRVANNSTPEECKDASFSESACGFVIEFEHIVTRRKMNSTATNVGGWPASEMRGYLNGEFLNMLPDVVKNNLKDTRVITGHGSKETSNSTSVDKIYLLSPKEVFGNADTMNATEYDSASQYTRQLDYYTSKGVSPSRRSNAVKKELGGNAYAWWLRTPHSNAYNIFYLIAASSNWSDRYFATSTYGVSPAFRIG